MATIIILNPVILNLMNTPFNTRGNNFDFLRLFLAVLVILSHSYALGIGNQLADPILVLTGGQAEDRHIAVDSFFMISGFLITASFERSGTMYTYFKKRIFCIYPAFIVAMLLEAVLFLPTAGAAFLKSAGGTPLDFLIQTVHLREFHYVPAFG